MKKDRALKENFDERMSELDEIRQRLAVILSNATTSSEPELKDKVDKIEV